MEIRDTRAARIWLVLGMPLCFGYVESSPALNKSKMKLQHTFIAVLTPSWHVLVTFMLWTEVSNFDWSNVLFDFLAYFDELSDETFTNRLIIELPILPRRLLYVPFGLATFICWNSQSCDWISPLEFHSSIADLDHFTWTHSNLNSLAIPSFGVTPYLFETQCLTLLTIRLKVIPSFVTFILIYRLSHC